MSEAGAVEDAERRGQVVAGLTSAYAGLFPHIVRFSRRQRRSARRRHYWVRVTRGLGRAPVEDAQPEVMPISLVVGRARLSYRFDHEFWYDSGLREHRDATLGYRLFLERHNSHYNPVLRLLQVRQHLNAGTHVYLVLFDADAPVLLWRDSEGKHGGGQKVVPATVEGWEQVLTWIGWPELRDN